MSVTPMKRRTVDVTLFQGDDLQIINDHLREVQRAVSTPGLQRLGDADPIIEKSKDYDTFMEEALTRASVVRLEALPRKKWRDLLDAHPVRMVPEVPEPGEDPTGRLVPHDDDAPFGFNFKTLCDDLVPASVAADQFDSAEDRDAFLDDLADGDFSKLYSAAVSLNRNQGPDPKARLSSHLDLISDATSESQERLN